MTYVHVLLRLCALPTDEVDLDRRNGSMCGYVRRYVRGYVQWGEAGAGV